MEAVIIYIQTYHAQQQELRKPKANYPKVKFSRFILLLVIMIICLSLSTMMNANANKMDSFLEPNHNDPMIVYAEKGDSLWSIAREYKSANDPIATYIHKLKKLNGLTSSLLQEGQKLMIPNG